jgi:hypothetical protein
MISRLQLEELRFMFVIGDDAWLCRSVTLKVDDRGGMTIEVTDVTNQHRAALLAAGGGNAIPTLGMPDASK